MRRKIWILVTLLIILASLYILRCSSGTSDTITSASPKTKKESFLREAMFYKVLAGDEVQCQMCFRKCIIPEGRRGTCRNRENREGKLYSVVYGRTSAVHVDPIEKEPQYHFLPGSEILCIGTAGCNFRCRHSRDSMIVTIYETRRHCLLPHLSLAFYSFSGYDISYRGNC